MSRKKLYITILSISVIIFGVVLTLAGLSLKKTKTSGIKIQGTAIEGIATGDKTYNWPTDEKPVLYGYVNVAYNQTSGGTRAPHSTSLLKNNYLGSPTITIIKDDGSKENVTLINPLETWFGTNIIEKKYADLSEIPEFEKLKPKNDIPNFLNYSVSVLAIHPGDRLYIDKAQDGTATKVWFGGKESFEKQLKNYYGE